MRLLSLWIAASSAAYCGGAELFAQGGAYSESGKNGITAGLVGGGAAFTIRPGLAVFGEFNYIPLSIQARSRSIDLSGYGLQAGGGVRAYLNPKGKTVRAFVSGVGGAMRASASGRADLWWGAAEVSSSANGGYVGAGFGAEIGPRRFGVRPEFRYIRELVSGAEDGNAVIAMCGVYYRF